MTLFINVRKQTASLLTCMILMIAGVAIGQTSKTQMSPLNVTPPTLGTTSSYGAFTEAGAIGNTGLTQLTGDIGTNAGAFTGFPPGQYSGAKHVADPQSLVAKNDLTSAYNQGNLISCDTSLSVTLGNGQVLIPRTSCAGPASTLSGNLTFDAKGDPSAVFVVKIGGALNVAANTHILLANGAQAANVYWIIDGAVSILDNSVFKGTIIANGAIHLYTGTSLEGRALSVVGAITMASNIISVPTGGGIPNTLLVITPAPGDSVRGGTQNYTITFAGSGIAAKKTFEYSLDSGKTYTRIGEITADVNSYNWNVPDTSSNKAMVRITDGNGLVGKSGVFTITSSKPTPGTIVILTPAAKDTVKGNTQNYLITYSGTNIAQKKTFSYSLDGGATWTTIGTITSDAKSFSWNVPDTAVSNALVRITDGNGVVATSGAFVIKSSKVTPPVGSIVVVTPAAGAVIAGNTQNYNITFTGSNIAALKTFEYSLDGGMTWTFIGTQTSDATSYLWANVPNIATTNALIRITDGNKVVGTSGLFTITKTPGVGSLNSLTLTGLDNNSNIGNNQQLGINWTFTPDIGTSVTAEYTLDQGITWVPISTVQTSETPSTTWMTTGAGYHNPVYVRITSSNGMRLTSQAFSIGSQAGVAFGSSANGYSVSNYPNPASGTTNIAFTLPVASEVSVSITDALGREVATITSAHFDAGMQSIGFDATNLAAGAYRYTLHAGSTNLVGRMLIVK